MKKFTVLSNLNHNGQSFGLGDQVELSSEEAAPLLKDKVISSDKVPVVKEADWKKGPKDIVPGPEAEVDETGEKVDEEEEQQEEVENKIAGTDDDTNDINTDDKDL